MIKYTSFCNDSAFALTWPSMTEATLEMLARGIEGTVEAVER